jgi:hypothetical protein
MEKKMPTGVFRLKGSNLQEMGKLKGVQNVHQISMRAGISYPTAYRYIEKPEKVEAISLRALYGVLIDSFGLSQKEIAELKFGDVFELVPDKRL